MDNVHICQDSYRGLGGMKDFYGAIGAIATSIVADVALIRSYLAYHRGSKLAEGAAIKPSRGHSYRIALYGKHDKHDLVARITDHYDHREGVTILS
jgi:hypothetical protein